MFDWRDARQDDSDSSANEFTRTIVASLRVIGKARIVMERKTSNHSNPLTDIMKEFPGPDRKRFRLLYKRLDLVASLIHIQGINLVAQ